MSASRDPYDHDGEGYEYDSVDPTISDGRPLGDVTPQGMQMLHRARLRRSEQATQFSGRLLLSRHGRHDAYCDPRLTRTDCRVRRRSMPR